MCPFSALFLFIIRGLCTHVAIGGRHYLIHLVLQLMLIESTLDPDISSC